MQACAPDVVAALSDVPFTRPPYSQKRITKSLERSTAWLAEILRLQGDPDQDRLNVLVHLAGAHDARARQAFSEGLVEKMYGKDAELVVPLKTLDEGLSGYILDLAHLKASLAGSGTPDPHEVMFELCKASLTPLPVQKLRIAHTPTSPHEALRLIENVGIDLLDAPWAQQAADLGIALDFRFPVSPLIPELAQACSPPVQREGSGRDIGHNLFSSAYAHDHSRFASSFLDAAFTSRLPDGHEANSLVCTCMACSPTTTPECVAHSSVDSLGPANSPSPNLPYTRAYVHHLLHTHEMSSHTLLAMHNLTVVDRFFADIRKVLSEHNGKLRFQEAAKRFLEEYDERFVVFDEARAQWAKVERERGKGRLNRDKDSDVGVNAD
ncbi:uncharacterized protein PHACADRAFT_256422 [Phanerochaete carnosa HHB-10118-sp]|uniref:tRNA-guanine(15) transglycosylase-like domain-containing protein n=1 Tax=Phanerochaete carnosa (strain HHB-10118-sp) TaxID=650164 RepID=K5WYR1_PHACS|nr:uncharacterized protein PHACADRAFT_256422 [Phanerochaete carnosa HHB-10118-sp]EKM55647.1 hypothetical protein PHACADRAFT_256422 [Phanerochaete carnosa HHB-10118-sp]